MPHDEVAMRVESLCGPVLERRALQTWGTSVVVSCRLADQTVIYKSGGEGSIPGEAAAMRLAAAAGVAAPEVLHVVDDETVVGGGWLVMSALPGASWQLDDPIWQGTGTIDDLNPVTLDGIAATFVALHQVSGEGSGPVGADGRGTSSNWAAWLGRHAARACPGLLSAGALDSSEVAQVNDFFARRRHWFATRPLRLVHGDLGNGEIFVDDAGRVVGIADFGNAVWGDPIFDFAHFVGGGPADDPRPGLLLPPVLERYWRELPREPDWDQFFAAYLAFNHVRNLAWAVQQQLTDWIPGLRTDLLRQLRLAGG